MVQVHRVQAVGAAVFEVGRVGDVRLVGAISRFVRLRRRRLGQATSTEGQEGSNRRALPRGGIGLRTRSSGGSRHAMSG